MGPQGRKLRHSSPSPTRQEGPEHGCGKEQVAEVWGPVFLGSCLVLFGAVKFFPVPKGKLSLLLPVIMDNLGQRVH